MAKSLQVAGFTASAHGFAAATSAGLGICVARERQKQGVGSEMMRRLLEWSDNWAGYLRIELNVYTDNERAIALYRRFGFEMEGTHRAHALRDGVYVDTHAMARFHPNPPQVPRQIRQTALIVEYRCEHFLRCLWCFPLGLRCCGGQFSSGLGRCGCRFRGRVGRQRRRGRHQRCGRRHCESHR